VGFATVILSKDCQGYFENDCHLKMRNQGAQTIFCGKS
jgi:hypothetical protein